MPRPDGKDERTFITVHDGMPEHGKIEGLSDAAFRQLIELWCLCSRTKNDGLLTEASWRKRGTPRTRKELLDAGLAETVGGGIQMHDYLKHQRSAAEIAEIQETKRAAGKKGAGIGNHKRHHVGKGVFNPECEWCVDASAEPSAEARHVPTESLGKRSAKRRTETETETEVPVELDLGGHRRETFPASAEPEPPRCIAHQGLPEDRVPPCRGCMIAAEKATEAATVTTAAQSLSIRMAIDHCRNCNDDGWIEDPGTHDPIARCDHADHGRATA